MSLLVHNEKTKLLATALNNLGVASIVTGAFAPVAAHILGSLTTDDPLRLASVVVIWLAVGVGLFAGAHRILRELKS